MKTLLLLTLALFSQITFAKISPNLVAIAADDGGFPAKALCYFSNNYLVPHPQGILVHYTCIGGPEINSEIWLVNDRPTQIGVSKMGNLFTSPVVKGDSIYFMEFSEARTEHVWQYQNGKILEHQIPRDLRGAYIHSFALLGDNLYFTYTNRSAGLHGEGIFNQTFQLMDSRDNTQFIWGGFSNGEIFLQKLRTDKGDVVEYRSKGNESPVIILKDQTADPESSFRSLRNHFSFQGNHWVSIAQTDKGLVLIRGEGPNTKTEDLSELFKDIQHWPPALAKDGEVIFRGTDRSGVFALWGYKNGQKRIVVGSDEIISRDGEVILTSPSALLYNSPVFDAKGTLYIGVGLRTQDARVDFGQGVLAL